MTESNIGQPIWTPADAAQTARDAAQHVGYRGEPSPLRDAADELYLDRLEASPPIVPPASWNQMTCYRTGGCRPTVHMRPRRALLIGRLLLTLASLVLLIAVASLWMTR